MSDQTNALSTSPISFASLTEEARTFFRSEYERRCPPRWWQVYCKALINGELTKPLPEHNAHSLALIQIVVFALGFVVGHARIPLFFWILFSLGMGFWAQHELGVSKGRACWITCLLFLSPAISIGQLIEEVAARKFAKRGFLYNEHQLARLKQSAAGEDELDALASYVQQRLDGFKSEVVGDGSPFTRLLKMAEEALKTAEKNVQELLALRGHSKEGEEAYAHCSTLIAENRRATDRLEDAIAFHRQLVKTIPDEYGNSLWSRSKRYQVNEALKSIGVLDALPATDDASRDAREKLMRNAERVVVEYFEEMAEWERTVLVPACAFCETGFHEEKEFKATVDRYRKWILDLNATHSPPLISIAELAKVND